jgi:hypothetical protein
MQMKSRELALGAIVVAFAASASADDANVEKPAPRYDRVFGIGTILGGGFTVATLTTSTGSSSASGVNGAIMLPTIELQGFITPAASIGVSIPITNIIIASAALGGVVFSGQALFEIGVGHDFVRGIFGIGLGGDYVSGSFFDTSITGGGLQIPGEIGIELSSARKGFGFRFLARPYIEIGSSTSRDLVTMETTGGSYVGGAVLFAVGFYAYIAREKH